MKKVWLMGKVRDLDLNDLKPFEDGVNDDLANFYENNLSGSFSAATMSQKMVRFIWKLSVRDEYQPKYPDGIPLFMWWLITGDCADFQLEYDFPTNIILNQCPNAIITFTAKDVCDYYKDNSKYYGADKFKKVDIKYIPNAGLTMTLKFYSNGK